MCAWDNIGGDEAEPVLPGGIYHVDTGAGVVHNETMEPVDLRPRTQPGFDDEPESVPCAAGEDHSSMCQLWWNAIDPEAPEDAPLRPVTTQVVKPGDVPRVTQEGGVSLRVLAGTYRGCTDPCQSIQHPVLLMHVRLEPGADGTLSPLPSDFNGFVWCLEGSATVGGGDAAGRCAAAVWRVPPDRRTLRRAGARAPCTGLRWRWHAGRTGGGGALDALPPRVVERAGAGAGNGGSCGAGARQGDGG